MRHVILTCKNHPNLRWSCKEIAFTPGMGYNGSRGLFFNGVPTGEGMFADGSGLKTTRVMNDELVEECDCKVTDLVLAPEDALVRRSGVGE